MFSIRLGIKNLFRQKRRNIITILIIGFAFFVYLFVESLMDGMLNMSIDNIRNFETGDIQIANSEYWKNRDDLSLEHLIEWNKELEEHLMHIESVTGVSPELRFSANLNNGIDEMGVIGLGIAQGKYKEVFQTHDYFVEGSMSVLDKNQAVIGKKLAELMDLKMNDYIILLVRTKEDTFNTIDVEIGGIVHTLNPMVNNSTVFISLDLAQERLNADNGITMLSLRTSSDRVEPVIQSINEDFRGESLKLQAYSWRESAQDMIVYSEVEKQAVAAMMSVVLLIGIVGIINNIVLSSLERKSEIGMMKALGMREWEIVFVFMVESAGIGILGGLAGCLMGLIGVSYLVNRGFYFAFYGDWSQYGIPIIDRIYGNWNLPTFSYIFILSVIVAILSSIFPAYWAAHKDPVEAIYHR